MLLRDAHFIKGVCKVREKGNRGLFMVWQDSGVVLHYKLLAERGCVVTLLTREHGRHKGLVLSRKTCFFHASQVEVTWQSRIEEHLGVFKMDQPYGYALMLLAHPGAMKILALMCMMCFYLLPERLVVPGVYEHFSATLHALGGKRALYAYALFETTLLQELGHDVPPLHPLLLHSLQERHPLVIAYWPHLSELHAARQHFLEDIAKALS